MCNIFPIFVIQWYAWMNGNLLIISNDVSLDNIQNYISKLTSEIYLVK